ncbi:MAG: hypothetical protein Q8L34_06685 [Candidatus Woesearchaeota archaeon]|nr:hypothetical protein [Candidatus Woesearchaeota archaeon]
MTLRRMRRKIRQHKNKIVAALITIVVIALLVFLLTLVKLPSLKKTYEITEVDVLAIKGIEGDQITLKGIKIGDGMQTVLDAIGYPDSQTIYDPDITNMEFGKAFDLNETGVILQFKGDSLEKMTVLPSFNTFLQGSTKVFYTKDEFLITFGKSDSVKQMPVTQGSAMVIRVYTYNEGIHFTTRRGVQIALSFTRPNIDITEP